MEEQTLDIVEILGLILFLGSLVYLVGISFQLFISIRQDKKFKFKQLILILSTHIGKYSCNIPIMDTVEFRDGFNVWADIFDWISFRTLTGA